MNKTHTTDSNETGAFTVSGLPRTVPSNWYPAAGTHNTMTTVLTKIGTIATVQPARVEIFRRSGNTPLLPRSTKLRRGSTEKEERLTVPVGTMLVVGEGIAPWKVIGFLAA